MRWVALFLTIFLGFGPKNNICKYEPGEMRRVCFLDFKKFRFMEFVVLKNVMPSKTMLHCRHFKVISIFA